MNYVQNKTTCPHRHGLYQLHVQQYRTQVVSLESNLRNIAAQVYFMLAHMSSASY